MIVFMFFFQAEDGIRDLVRSRGLGDVYKRQLSSFQPRLARLVLVSALAVPMAASAQTPAAAPALSLIHI